MTQNNFNGGFFDYPNRVTTDVFFRKAEDRSTATGTIKSGQVLKKYSWLQSDATGKLIAHTGLAESANVTFKALTTGQTLILAGLTFTAGTGSVTVAQLATIWEDLPAGTTAAAANTILLARGIDATVTGTFTAGTLTGWNTRLRDAADTVVFTSTTALTNVTDLAATGTGTAPTIAKVDGAVFAPIVGVLLYDVDASGGDVNAEYFTEASFWASALVWSVDTAKDTIALSDGTTKAVTAYNTGTNGFDGTSDQLLQQKFVEGSMFVQLGFLTAGETYNA